MTDDNRRTPAIEIDLLACLDAMPAVEAHDQAGAMIAQGEYELACELIQAWIAETAAHLPARALQALARADLSLKLAARRV